MHVGRAPSYRASYSTALWQRVKPQYIIHIYMRVCVYGVPKVKKSCICIKCVVYKSMDGKFVLLFLSFRVRVARQVGTYTVYSQSEPGHGVWAQETNTFQTMDGPTRGYYIIRV